MSKIDIDLGKNDFAAKMPGTADTVMFPEFFWRKLRGYQCFVGKENQVKMLLEIGHLPLLV
jgi:hypothetical protein